MDTLKELLSLAGILAAILYAVKLMMGRARSDATLAEMNKEAQAKKKEAHQKEIEKLTQEIEDAKIDYKRIRDGKSTQPAGPGSDV